ncbi:hypothetical protein DFH06DRAFT_68426 [Mycena polygramma]|nr:hypothetical protein DFH06DRAFT_68426 [Mycena polygramma]
MSDMERIKEELEKDNRNVSALWNDALKKYRSIVGVQLQPNASLEDIIKDGTEQMNKFHKFRHNQKKVDKLRALFKANMDYAMKGAQQLVTAATPAFPPAAVIGTAFTYMLSACKQVSTDYDVITSFFEDMNSFLQRITILETRLDSRLPRYPAYRNCLMDVFTSLLEMCGYATMYIELGRFRKWILTMVRGQDDDLGAARKKMDKSLSRLQSATSFAILGNTEEMRRMTLELQDNQDKHTRMLDAQTEMLGTVLQSQDIVRSDIQKLITMFLQTRGDEPSKMGKSGSHGKPPTSNRVRTFFGVTVGPMHEDRSIKDSLIQDTCTWILEEPAWHNWTKADGKQRFLTISGPPGAGKSYLAAFAYDRLIAAENEQHITCVTHFYFRENIEELNHFSFAVWWIVIQIAEQNPSLCEKINFVLSKDDLFLNTYDGEDVLNKLIAPLFDESSKERLQIVLDGLDELDSLELNELFKFFQAINRRPELKISTLCTTLPGNIQRQLEENFDAASLEVTKEKQVHDLKALIWGHLHHDSRLRKLSRYMKHRITGVLEDKANGMLYAEHILRHFDVLGREPLILKELECMPDDLDGLYRNMLANLQRRTAIEQQVVLKSLLSWHAFSFRPLTLDESLALIPGGSLNLEEELQGQHLSKLFRIADFDQNLDTQSSAPPSEFFHIDYQPEVAYNDGNLPLTFQERSMRDFFRNAGPDEEISSLRTPARDAHRQIFIACAEILCAAEENVGTVQEGLQKYAAQCWAAHLAKTKLSAEDLAKDDQLPFLGVVGRLLTNSNNAAAKIEASGMDYYELCQSFDDPVLETLVLCAQAMTDLTDEMVSKEIMEWAKEVRDDKKKVLIQLARGHVKNWLESRDYQAAETAYRFARGVITKTHLSTLIPEPGNRSAQEILGIAKAFAELPGDARWAVGILLLVSRNHEEALAQGNLGVSECTNPARREKALLLVAQSLESLQRFDAAYDSINECLSNPHLSPDQHRGALLTRARLEVALGKLVDAAKSYREARLADPDRPATGYALHDEFTVYVRMGSDAELVSIVKQWTPLERVAWMTWRYSEDHSDHRKFQDATGRCGEEDFLVTAYEEVINFLDTLESGAPMRLQLSAVHYHVRGDLDAARATLDGILDSTTTGKLYAFTDEEPAFILPKAVNFAIVIIYEQFRSTGDRQRKAQLLSEARGLRERPLAQSTRLLETMLTHHTVVLARMVRKMGPMSEFQDLLDKAFQVCYTALFDNVIWNDDLTLPLMAEVLWNLDPDGLAKEACIMFSAVFSELNVGGDASNRGADEGSAIASTADHGGENEESHESPTIHGDLAYISYICDGCDIPLTCWSEPMYMCVFCGDTGLCDPCFQRRKQWNEGAKRTTGTSYCGRDHSYIKGPIDGRRGITNGVMSIEGEEPVPFKKWLEELVKKWEDTWERFWKSEEVCI